MSAGRCCPDTHPYAIVTLDGLMALYGKARSRTAAAAMRKQLEADNLHTPLKLIRLDPGDSTVKQRAAIPTRDGGYMLANFSLKDTRWREHGNLTLVARSPKQDEAGTQQLGPGLRLVAHLGPNLLIPVQAHDGHPALGLVGELRPAGVPVPRIASLTPRGFRTAKMRIQPVVSHIGQPHPGGSSDMRVAIVDPAKGEHSKLRPPIQLGKRQTKLAEQRSGWLKHSRFIDQPLDPPEIRANGEAGEIAWDATKNASFAVGEQALRAVPMVGAAVGLALAYRTYKNDPTYAKLEGKAALLGAALGGVANVALSAGTLGVGEIVFSAAANAACDRLGVNLIRYFGDNKGAHFEKAEREARKNTYMRIDFTPPDDIHTLTLRQPEKRRVAAWAAGEPAGDQLRWSDSAVAAA